MFASVIAADAVNGVAFERSVKNCPNDSSHLSSAAGKKRRHTDSGLSDSHINFHALHITRSKFGIGSHEAMLHFAGNVSRYVPNGCVFLPDQVRKSVCVQADRLRLISRLSRNGG